MQHVANFIYKTDYRTYNKYGNFCAGTIIKRFGSWNLALEKAGLFINLSKIANKVNKKDLIKDLKRVANGKSISRDYYNLHGQYDYTTFLRHFKSWRLALKAAGLKITHAISFTCSKKDLIKYLHKRYKELGYPPLAKDMLRPNDSVYYRHFPNKTWGEILLEAGIPNCRQPIGLDGLSYDSLEEMKVANLFVQNNIRYESHKLVCKDRKWTCDFYLLDYDLWVEYDGLEERRERFSKGRSTFKEKIQYYIDNKYQYYILYQNNLKTFIKKYSK